MRLFQTIIHKNKYIKRILSISPTRQSLYSIFTQNTLEKKMKKSDNFAFSFSNSPPDHQTINLKLNFQQRIKTKTKNKSENIKGT